MKPRRRTLLLSLALLVVAGGVLSLPAVHWRLIGWWRGESFYQGRPTSYWKQDARGCEMRYAALSNDLYLLPAQPSSRAVWLEKHLGINAHRSNLFGEWDANALPVVLEMLASEETLVQLYAIWVLRALKDQALPAWTALRDLRRTSREYVIIREARHTLYEMDPKAFREVAEDRPDEEELFQRFRQHPGIK